jgi:hypothetical protein
MNAPISTLFTTLRRGIWRVTLDGAFYGDYRSARHASDSVEAAALALRKAGRVVNVIGPAIPVVS